jgi:hypothetical protein
MVRTPRPAWRLAIVIGCVAGVGAVYPLSGFAQEQPPLSGAAVEVGGVQARAPSAGGPASTTSGAPGRTLILPNTGTGPMDEDTNNYDASALAISAGLLALGAGAYVHRRRSRNHVGG